MDIDHKSISDYRRELNISNAISTVSYKSDGKLIREEIFVSNPHKAIIIKLSSDAPKRWDI